MERASTHLEDHSRQSALPTALADIPRQLVLSNPRLVSTSLHGGRPQLRHGATRKVQPRWLAALGTNAPAVLCKPLSAVSSQTEIVRLNSGWYVRLYGHWSRADRCACDGVCDCRTAPAGARRLGRSIFPTSASGPNCADQSERGGGKSERPVGGNSSLPGRQ